jgi:hypothetical protein
MYFFKLKLAKKTFKEAIEEINEKQYKITDRP